MDIKKIGILFHPMVAVTQSGARELEDALIRLGVTAWTCSAWEKEQVQQLLPCTDLVLTVGGDGTILRAVQAVIPATTPITGVNQGKLGFLTELDAAGAISQLPGLLAGKGWLDKRALLQADLVTAEGERRTFHALNDVVLARGEVARLIRVEAAVNGQLLTTYATDAMIVATATGSTGYALAARGPIIYPQSPDILLVPVAPHLSLGYPLVLPESAVITLRLKTYQSATLSIDGHINLPLADGAAVTVTRSPYTAAFYRVRPEGSFYRSLEEKLKGRQGAQAGKG